MKILIKRTIYLSIIFLFTILFIPTKTVNAISGVPERIVVTFYDETANSRGFNWVTNTTVEESKLQIIKKTANINKTNVDWSNAVVVAATSNDFHPGYRSWKAFVLDLEYQETYYYRVGRDGAWSSVGEQYITDGREGIYFGHVTDPQSYSAQDYTVWTNTLNKIDSNFPKLTSLIITGDITQQNRVATDNINEWGYALDGPKALFMDNVVSPNSGNHDKADDMFVNHFNIKVPNEQDTTTGQYYSYRISDVEVFVLNTNDELSFTEPLARLQYNWLEDALKNSTATWKIVSMHFAVISTGRHMLENDIAMLRNDLMPLFSKYHVDLVLQGHDHVYTRANPYLWDNTGFVANTNLPTKSTTINNSEYKYYDAMGTFYVIQNMATARAAALSPLADPVDFPAFFKIANSPITGQLMSIQPKVPTFGIISIKDGKLLYETYLLEQFQNVILIDYFAVEKISVNYVNERISELKDNYHQDDINEIAEVANLFYSLNEFDQNLVSDHLYNKLTDLLRNISLTNYNQASKVIKMIEDIKYKKVDTNLMTTIEEINSEYQKLSNIGKSYVYNYEILEMLEEQYEMINDANLVINLIEALKGNQNVTLVDVENVSLSYNQLTNDAKFKVSNYFDLAIIAAEFNLFLEQLGE